jgi:hypothetical protein
MIQATSWVISSLLGLICGFFLTGWAATPFLPKVNPMAPMAGIDFIGAIVFSIPAYIILTVVLLVIVYSSDRLSWLKTSHWKRLAFQTVHYSVVLLFFISVRGPVCSALSHG